jgi:hypothetical protein
MAKRFQVGIHAKAAFQSPILFPAYALMLLMRAVIRAWLFTERQKTFHLAPQFGAGAQKTPGPKCWCAAHKWVEPECATGGNDAAIIPKHM